MNYIWYQPKTIIKYDHDIPLSVSKEFYHDNDKTALKVEDMTVRGEKNEKEFATVDSDIVFDRWINAIFGHRFREYQSKRPGTRVE